MTIDLNNDVFITGTTTSNQAPPSSQPTTFPQANSHAISSSPKASLQFFVTKLNTSVPVSGQHRVFDILRREHAGDSVCQLHVGGGIAVDSTGNIYFSGTTNFYNSGLGAYGAAASGRLPHPQRLSALPGYASADRTLESESVFASDDHAVSDRRVHGQNKSQCGANGCAQLLFSTYLGGSGADSALRLRLIPARPTFTSRDRPILHTDFRPSHRYPPYQTCLNNPGGDAAVPHVPRIPMPMWRA